MTHTRRLSAVGLTAAATLLGLVGAPSGIAASATPSSASYAVPAQPARSAAHSVARAKRPVERLRHHGRWLIDNRGRVVILHGINAVWKYAPYVAPRNTKGFTVRDADFLARNGFNAVRLGVLFAGVMPTEGKVDQRYLTSIDRIVRLLAKRHIYTLLDFHQDAYNEKFNGEGFPAWAVHDDGIPFQDAGSFFANYQTPAVERTFDHFWANDFGLVDNYAKAWRAVARKWRNQPYLMGYDLFNEPSAGSQTGSCANPAGCPAFDATMQGVFDQIRHAIRTVDRKTMVWYEPQFYFNAISRGNFTKVDDPQVGLSWHDYACTPAFVAGGVLPGDPDCIVNEGRVMDNAGDQADRMGSASVLTEFGAGDDLEDLARLTGLADDRLNGWMYWAYKTWDDPTGSDKEGLFAQDGKLSSLKVAKLKTLVRPYAQAIAGTPTSYRWDPAARVWRFTYRAKAGGVTRVYVPRVIYPRGSTLTATGVKRLRSHTAQIVLLRATKKGLVTLTVRPR